MMKSIRRAAKANQEGSTLLELDQTGKALKCFRSAIKELKEGSQSSLDNLPSGSLDECTMVLSSKPVRLGEDYMNASLPEQEKTPDQPTELYSQAFVFQQGNNEGVFTIEQHRLYSAILVFNSALALHQKGGKEEGHKQYLKALLFYIEAKNMLQPMLETEAEAFRIVQEILKNQVDIYFRLNEVGKGQKVWEELATLTKMVGGATAPAAPAVEVASPLPKSEMAKTA